MSHLAGRVYSNSHDFIVTLQNVDQYVENTLKNSEDMAVIKIPTGITKTLGEAIQFLKRPEVNQESRPILDRMTHSFVLRTGLSELLYGISQFMAILSSAPARVACQRPIATYKSEPFGQHFTATGHCIHNP